MSFLTTTFAPLALLIEEAPTQPGGSSMLVPFVLILGVFYFLLIRPESRRRKQHDEMLGNLGKGDTILTNGGIVGKVVMVKENLLTLEISDGVRIKLVRHAIQGIVDPNTGQAPADTKVTEKGGGKKDSEESEAS